MGKTERKKELLAAYQSLPVTGGVCLVRNTATGQVWVFSARDLQAQRNRFAFSVSTGSPMHPSLGPDLAAHGPASFVLETPETLAKKPEQSDRAYLAELEALANLWREQLAAQGAVFYST